MIPSGVATRSIASPFGAFESGKHPPDRIRQFRNALDRGRDRFDPFHVEGEAVEEGGSLPLRPRLREIFAIRGEDLRQVGPDMLRHGAKRAVSDVGGGERHAARGGAGAVTEVGHHGGDIHVRFDRRGARCYGSFLRSVASISGEPEKSARS